MSEGLTKLRPDRDLQCYFDRPSAAAALSETTANGFKVSGCWRQQFDWAVVEWNRDNVFEHPALRNLPDGNLSGVHLAYEEERTNCVPLDSTLYPTVEWPYLRIWTESEGKEELYMVPLKNYATAIEGSYTPATAEFTLGGTPTAGDYVELAWLDQHYNYLMWGGDTLENAAATLASTITANQGSCGMSATATGTRIKLAYLGAQGANGNRIGAYGMVYGAGTESWSPASRVFSGGTSPARWRVELDFGALQGYRYPDSTMLVPVPTTNVRKMRWTWAADLQAGDFRRSEFSVAVTNWTVTGENLAYSVAGAGSRRIEDDAAQASYEGTWTEARGNYSGGSIRWTASPRSSVTCRYQAQTTHSLYLGTRRAQAGSTISVQVDADPAMTYELGLAGEDVLVRLALGELAGGTEHTVMVTHTGPAGTYFYFDFLEITLPSTALPDFETIPATSLATDWDTDHSIALPPERTAWLMQKLGFRGRVNHYAGALWFYELSRPGHQYASGTVTFTGTPVFGKITQVSIGGSAISQMNLIGDTAETIAKCFELLINAGSTAAWALAEGSTLTITSRVAGAAGNSIALAAATDGAGFEAQTSGNALSGGTEGTWRTDLEALPRLNRAARDWTSGFLRALKAYGVEVTVSFSMELQHGDDSAAAAIAQRYPDGSAAWLNTPALQTNFGPASTAFWKQVYLDMAGLMSDAGVTPYLQFGEVQWWYFAAPAGMPYYDDYTKTSFEALYGRPMALIADENADPAGLAEECTFLAELIGQFTDAVMAFVRQSHADALFEVLYPPDVNDTPLNSAVNFPSAHWTPATLDCLKTENFTYTGDRNLDKARKSIELPMTLGFARSRASHLVGISEYTTPWAKEHRLALGQNVESVVLFALDQFCLIGYDLPLEDGARRARFMGA